MGRRGIKKQITDYWYENHRSKGHCGLCGNTGYIDTTDRAKTPGGLSVGGTFFCVCPNGQLMSYHVKKGEKVYGKEA